MYLISESHFNKDIIMPSTSGSLDVYDGKDTTKQWIDSEVRLCLQNALGNVLFNQLDDNITDGVLNSSAPQIWIDLVKGKDYTYDGTIYTWKGLAYKEGDYNYSFLAYLVHAKHIDNERTRLSGIGEVSGNAINSSGVYTRRKYVTEYNNFVDGYCGESCNGYVSLITYLTHNETDYPDASKLPMYYENIMGF